MTTTHEPDPLSLRTARIVLVFCARRFSSSQLTVSTYACMCTRSRTHHKVSIPCIVYVFIVANSAPYLKGADDYTHEGALPYSLGNYTATNTTLCPEMDGLDLQRGATLDAQKTYTLTCGMFLAAWAMSTNSIALVCHLLTF